MENGWICKGERLPTAADADEEGRVLAWHRYQCGMLYAWDDLCGNRFITHWMPLRALRTAWIDAHKHPPTEEDADDLRCVLAHHTIYGVCIVGWFQIPGRPLYTHFARIPRKPT